MKQIDVAKQVGVTSLHMNAILAGRRNPSPRLATRLEQATAIPKEVWIFGTPEERRAAWEEKKRRKGSEP